MTQTDASRLSELRESARGWHQVQLAVLGFIGLCGVLLDGWTTQPRWLQLVAGALVVASLTLACLATYIIGRAAWPLYGPRHRDGPDGDASTVARTSRRITTGLSLTYVSVATLALATATAWWPRGDTGDRVQVETTSGSLCGALEAGGGHTISVASESGRVVIPFEALLSMSPVAECR